MWDMQIVRIFTVRILVLGSRAGGKIQDFLCMKKRPTRERTIFDYYFPFAPSLWYLTEPDSLRIMLTPPNLKKNKYFGIEYGFTFGLTIRWITPTKLHG